MLKTRLLFIAPSAYPLGGVADWLDVTLAGLAASGIRCSLALVEGGGHNVAAYLRRHPWTDSVAVANPTGSREGRVRALVSVIAASNAELVISVNLVDVYEAVRRLRQRAREHAPRVVMALHGLQATLIDDIRTQGDVLDGVVASNRLTERIAGEVLGDPNRVRYAPYGVPLPGVEASGAREPGKPLLLLYAGRIEQEQKRVLDLPLILVALRERGIDVRLSIAGGGPTEPALRAAIDAARVTSAVTWLGDLNPVRLAEAYRSHDALLITSVWETGPIVAWEAMSHGLPVASARYVGSGLEGALVDGETAVLFEVGDVSGAAAAIARLQQSALRERIIAGGLALIRDRYSRGASVRAWKSALESISTMPKKHLTAIRWSQPSGRLDRCMGVSAAESLRRALGIRFVPDSPGAAWPHTTTLYEYAREEAFLLKSRNLDAEK